MFRLGTAEAIAVGRTEAGGPTVEPPRLHADAVGSSRRCSPTSPAQRSAPGAPGFPGRPPGCDVARLPPGHLTASALVLDPPGDSVLLTLHPRGACGCSVGGHCERGPFSAGRCRPRGARGVGNRRSCPRAAPISLDVHSLTCSLGVPTRHFDVTYLAIAPDSAPLSQSHESLDLRWVTWDALPEGAAPNLPAMIEAARRRIDT